MSIVIEVAIEQPPSVSVPLKDVMKAARVRGAVKVQSKLPERRSAYNQRYHAREKLTIWRRPYQRHAAVRGGGS